MNEFSKSSDGKGFVMMEENESMMMGFSAVACPPFVEVRSMGARTASTSLRSLLWPFFATGRCATKTLAVFFLNWFERMAAFRLPTSPTNETKAFSHFLPASGTKAHQSYTKRRKNNSNQHISGRSVGFKDAA